MKNLSRKLIEVMKAVDAVEKHGDNKAQGYKYVKATDVAREVRAALILHGISFSFSPTATKRWKKETNSGGWLNFVEMWAEVTFTDVESGEALMVGAVGWGSDSGDKAIYKAQTGCLKYVLRMNFLIPDESDPENDSGEKEDRPTVQRKSQKETSAKQQQEPAGFDQDGEPFYDETPKPAPRPKVVSSGSSPKTISEAQQRRMFAMAMGRGWDKQVYREFISQHGYQSDKDVAWKDYEKMCQEIESA